MADLRAFQPTTSVDAARLQAIPTPTSAPSTAAILAQAGAGLATTLGAQVQATRKAEKEAGEQAFVGSLSDRLIKAQQAGQTNPKYNTASEQRKIIQKAIAENPQYADIALDTFKTATGLEVAGISAEEEARLKTQQAAWEAGFGSPDASPEYNRQQAELYTSLERESYELGIQTQRLAAEEAQGRIDRQELRTKTIQQTNKLASLKFESTALDMEDTIRAINEGELTVDQARQQWAMKRLQLSRDLNQFGELKNDPDVVAMLQPTFDLYDLADDRFTGKYEQEEINRQVQLTKDRATAAIIVNDPEATTAIVTSGLFGHTSGISSLMSKVASRIMTKGPADITNLTPQGSAEFSQMLRSAVKDPKAKDEAIEVQGKVVDHFSRNGMDYTDEQKFNIAKALNSPEVWAQMSAEKRQEVVFAFESYMVDVVDNVVREVQNETITTSEFQGVTGYREFETQVTTQPIADFATLVVDATGVRYEIKPDAPITRQLRNKVTSANRELGEKVNPMIEIIADATGQSREAVAVKYLGLGTDAEGDVETVPSTRATEAEMESPDAFRKSFIQAAVDAGSTEDEAAALFDEINQPATNNVNIGGVEMSLERAREVLSTPAR